MYHRLSEFGSLKDRIPVYTPLEDIAGKEVLIHDAEVHEGDYGPYVVIDCEIDGQRHSVRTGASLIVDALLSVKELNAFPVMGRFFKTGRLWRVM